MDYQPVIQKVPLHADVDTDFLRLDLLHPEVSGNKWFKLKYNIGAMQAGNCKGLLTFGGPHSNHIAATAAAGRMYGFETTGIIRGERPLRLSDTLLQAEKAGMQLVFVSRSRYTELKRQSGPSTDPEFESRFVVPEGGANVLGIKGAAEILQGVQAYDYVLCACGTATTFAGLISSAGDKSIVIGISVLKGRNTLREELYELTSDPRMLKIGGNDDLAGTIVSHLITNLYAGAGYAAYEPELARFKQNFEQRSGIMLDHVYTAKLVRAAVGLIEKRSIPPGSRILLIHSGGLQGNRAFEQAHGLQ